MKEHLYVKILVVSAIVFMAIFVFVRVLRVIQQRLDALESVKVEKQGEKVTAWTPNVIVDGNLHAEKMFSIWVARDSDEEDDSTYSIFNAEPKLGIYAFTDTWFSSNDESSLAYISPAKFKRIFGFELPPGGGPIKLWIVREK